MEAVDCELAASFAYQDAKRLGVQEERIRTVP